MLIIIMSCVICSSFIVDDLGELSAVQHAAPILLLSLLDGTASDTDLCRNSLTLLSQVSDF